VQLMCHTLLFSSDITGI